MMLTNLSRMYLQRARPLSAESKRLVALLKRYPIFHHLDAYQLAKLIPAVRAKTFSNEEITCQCPDASHDAFLLLRGTVAITRKQGVLTHVMQLEQPGAVFNLGPLVGLHPDPAGARALGDVEVLAVDTSMLAEALTKDCKLGYAVAKDLGRLAIIQCDAQIGHLLEAV